MVISKTKAAEILGICPTNFAKSVNSRWYKAVTADNKVDMSIAYKIEEDWENAKEYAEHLKAFSMYLKEEHKVSYKTQSELTGVHLQCFYTYKCNGKKLEPLIKLYPKAWKEFNVY